MRLTDVEVRLIHRLRGARDGEFLIRQKAGNVYEVAVNGRVLDDKEWQPVQMFHVEQPRRRIPHIDDVPTFKAPEAPAVAAPAPEVAPS